RSTASSATPGPGAAVLVPGGEGGAEPDGPPPSLDDLPGLAAQAGQLREWLDLGFPHTQGLARLGTTPQLRGPVAGPARAGKTTMVRAVAATVGARVVRRWAPGLAALTPDAAAGELRGALAEAARDTPCVLLVEDVEALAPRAGGQPGAAAAPLGTVQLEVVRAAVGRPGVAVVCTSARPEAVSPGLRPPRPPGPAPSGPPPG